MHAALWSPIPPSTIRRTRTAVSAVLLALASTLAAVGLGPVSAQDEPREPDIIVVLVDDLGYIEDERILERLPNVTEVFRDGGMRFTQMYTETPLCGPSRATMLTGQHTLHHGMVRNDGDALEPTATLPYALGESSDYYTGLVGKYLNQYSGEYPPLGWDEASVFYRQSERLKADAPGLIERAPADRPLFAWIAPTAPHWSKGKYQPAVEDQYRDASLCADLERLKPPNYKVWKNPKPFPRHMPEWRQGWPLTRTCESLIPVDEMIGLVVEAQAARDRPAFFVFTSDNGMAWGQHGYPAKHNPYSTRIPFYVAGPGIAPGTETDQLVSNIDIAPTLASIAGIELPAADGVDLLPLLEDEPYDGRRQMLEIYPSSDAKWEALREARWRYIRHQDGARHLYDLRTDPYEKRDLIDTKLWRAKRMDRELDRLIRASKR